MKQFQLGQDEVVRADVTAPASSLFFPFLELLLVTGLSWIAIGYLDQPGSQMPVEIRNGVVLFWALLAVWRFVLPLIRARRSRFVVTNQRVLVRAPTLRSRVDSIPLRQIHSVGRRRRDLSVSVWGLDRPLYFPGVPKAKRIEQLIRASYSRQL